MRPSHLGVAALLIVAIGGCVHHHTTTLARTASLADESVTFRLADGQKVPGKVTAEAAVTFSSRGAPIAPEAVRAILVARPGRGALEGFLMGALVGTGVGVVAGVSEGEGESTCGSDGCSTPFRLGTAGYCVLFGGLGGGIGALIGLAAGEDVYELKPGPPTVGLSVGPERAGVVLGWSWR